MENNINQSRYVFEHYIRHAVQADLEGLTVEVLDLLHEQFGVCFIGNDGQFSVLLPVTDRFSGSLRGR